MHIMSLETTQRFIVHQSEIAFSHGLDPKRTYTDYAQKADMYDVKNSPLHCMPWSRKETPRCS